MNRPKFKVEKTGLDIFLEILIIVVIILSAVLISYFYNQLPEKLPVYFNWPSKDKSGFGTKDLLWTSPAISGLIAFGIYKLNQFPWIFNYPTQITKDNALNNYKIATLMLRILTLMIAITFFLFTVASILNGLGNKTDFNKYFYPLFPIIMTGFPLVYLILAKRNLI